ncbi:PREDICTED: periodic tryptophan protein 2 homolog [Ceratosolen solmsi marchali]|uniref:Periodic tryptophan protein 2 homolog n=1 Tax=Ceratosolen solmsi marchali TaxID=326594 RepID=A0AAJ6YM95_9HYME|nr:PREDICTED: periodic tryptophan protein 2 homolog [Ceratosolen solmsi marchali]
MKFAYKFSNLLGSVYYKGNLLFTNDGMSVISPVGNRITIYDLKNNKSLTLPIESRFNYNALDLSPNGYILIAINEEGEAHVISMISKMIIHKHRFKRKVQCIKFSPDGKHFAVCKENTVFIFTAPGLLTGEYNPFVMVKVFHDAVDDVSCIQWSFDSKLLIVGSKDKSTRLYSLEKWMNFKKYILGSHSDAIVGCYFEKKNYDILTISRNGHFCIWECTIEPSDLVLYQPPLKKLKLKDSDSEDDVDLDKALEKTEKEKRISEKTLIDNANNMDNDEVRTTRSKDKIDNKDVKKLMYKRLGKYYLADEVHKSDRNAVLTAAAYHQDTHILVVGFNNGAFFLYEMPEVNMIHSLSMSSQRISSIALNTSGDWIALGSADLGQLLVWEWQSETYAMKQQGHSSNMNCIAYSPDGQLIVTGGTDGKLKLWSTSSGFCSVTFHDHTSSISGVLFSTNRKFILSASLDGTVRAYDLMRYRNFKTFTSPRPVQFSCVALDSSDEFVVAGGQDVFEIYLWSIKLGTLLEILSGHEGPVMSVAFNPNPASTELVSVSWDKTLKIWNAIENGSNHETIQLISDGLYVTYKPNGTEIAVATLDGQISFFDCKTGTQLNTIEGRNDLGSGRSDTDLITAKKSLEGKAFTSLSFTADGNCILAGGQSKYVCIYSVKESILLKKFEITQNRSLDAVDDFINRRKLTEFGNLALVEEREENEGGNVTIRLPGVRQGDMAARNSKPEIRIFSLQFSPTGQAWAAATTEGLLIYSLNVELVFDPFELEIGITPMTVKETLAKGEFSTAIIMALKLNVVVLIREVIEDIPYSDIELTAASIPRAYVERLLKFIANEIEESRHIHFYLLWIEAVLTEHGPKGNAILHLPTLILLQKNMLKKYDDLSKICDFNQYTIGYLKQLSQIKGKQKVKEIEEDVTSDNEVDEENMEAE